MGRTLEGKCKTAIEGKCKTAKAPPGSMHLSAYSHPGLRFWTYPQGPFLRLTIAIRRIRISVGVDGRDNAAASGPCSGGRQRASARHKLAAGFHTSLAPLSRSTRCSRCFSWFPWICLCGLTTAQAMQRPFPVGTVNSNHWADSQQREGIAWIPPRINHGSDQLNANHSDGKSNRRGQG